MRRSGIVLANDRFAEIYGLRPEQVQPGMTLREVVEHRIAAGLYPARTSTCVWRSCASAWRRDARAT